MPIDFEQWVSDARQAWRSSPKRALFEAGYYAYCGVWLTVTSRRRLQLGTNVYDRDWDLLILLDACRIDALRHVASDFDVLPAASDIDSMWSLGSASAEWFSKTFTADYTDEIAETIYLSANPYSVKIFDNGFCAPPNAAPFGFPKRNTVKSSDFKQIYNLTRTHCDERYNVVLPVDLTDAAIQVGRNTDAHRYIVHYMQPHVPYLARAIADDRDMTATERDAFDRLGSNGLDYATIKRWYIETELHARMGAPTRRELRRREGRRLGRSRRTLRRMAHELPSNRVAPPEAQTRPLGSHDGDRHRVVSSGTGRRCRR